jgi:prolyl-tRNA synthetase
VLPYCESLREELAALSYGGEPIRVRIDNRDIRGGEEMAMVKRGVPLRGGQAADVVANNVAVGRRRGDRELRSCHAKFVATSAIRSRRFNRRVQSRRGRRARQ